MALSKYQPAQSDHVVYHDAPQHQYALCGPASLLRGTHATDNLTLNTGGARSHVRGDISSPDFATVDQRL